MSLITVLLLSFVGRADSSGLVLGGRVRVTKIVVGNESRRSALVDRLTFGLTERSHPDHAARRSLIARTVEAFVEKLDRTTSTKDLPKAHVHLTLADRDFNEVPSRGRGELGSHYFLGYEVRMHLVFPGLLRPGTRSPEVKLHFFGTRHLGDPKFHGAYLAHVGDDDVAGDFRGAVERLFASPEWVDSPCAKRLAAPVHSETAK